MMTDGWVIVVVITIIGTAGTINIALGMPHVVTALHRLPQAAGALHNPQLGDSRSGRPARPARPSATDCRGRWRPVSCRFPRSAPD
jgi:hypothetical protein